MNCPKCGVALERDDPTCDANSDLCHSNWADESAAGSCPFWEGAYAPEAWEEIRRWRDRAEIAEAEDGMDVGAYDDLRYERDAAYEALEAARWSALGWKRASKTWRERAKAAEARAEKVEQFLANRRESAELELEELKAALLCKKPDGQTAAAAAYWRLTAEKAEAERDAQKRIASLLREKCRDAGDALAKVEAERNQWRDRADRYANDLCAANQERALLRGLIREHNAACNVGCCGGSNQSAPCDECPREWLIETGEDE